MAALQVPEAYRKDVERAVAILKDAGCSHVYLFGSLGLGRPRPTSDIDLAIRGCPKGRFFYLLGKLMLELDRPVLATETIDALAVYLGFRHFYRHSYSFYIDWDELNKPVRPLPETWRQVKAELEEFMRGLQS